jgi:acyl carrier protein
LTGVLLERVRQLVSDIFAVPLEQVDANSSPETIEAWDSMQHLNLVLAVEDRFNLQFTPEEMEQMRSVEQIVTMVESRT